MLKVTLLFASGHTIDAVIDDTDPSLVAIIETIASRNHPERKSVLCNMTDAISSRSLIFNPCDVVAFHSYPTLALENPAGAGLVNQSILEQSQDRAVIIDSFLPEHEMTRLLRLCHEQLNGGHTGGGKGEASDRESGFLVEASKTLRDAMMLLTLPMLHAVIEKLLVSYKHLTDFRCWLSCYHCQDGDDSISHSDYSPPSQMVEARSFHAAIAYSYFIHHDPLMFTGGDLIIGNVENSYPRGSARDVVHVKPLPNRIVFFPGWIEAKVSRVKALSPRRQDGRLTIDGFICAEEN